MGEQPLKQPKSRKEVLRMSLEMLVSAGKTKKKKKTKKEKKKNTLASKGKQDKGREGVADVRATPLRKKR